MRGRSWRIVPSGELAAEDQHSLNNSDFDCMMKTSPQAARGCPPLSNRKSALQVGAAFALSLGFVVLPIVNSFVSSPVRQPVSSQFTVMPPVDPNFAPVFTETPVLPTPFPTVGPGQSFDQDSLHRPETVTREGDDQFGYGRIAGTTDLLLLWYTDNTGTHYLVVDETNEDQKSLVQYFQQQVDDRKTKLEEIATKELELQETVSRGRRNEAFTVGIAIAGGICGVLTGGICIPVALAALGAYGLAWDEYFRQERQSGERDLLRGQLAETEANLAGSYNLLASTMPP